MKLLEKLPRNSMIWMPFLMLPLVVSAVWLQVQQARLDQGATLTLVSLAAFLAWYLLGGSLACAQIRREWLQRRQLGRLRGLMEKSGRAECAIAADGMVLDQSPHSMEAAGDWRGRPVFQMLAGQLADAEGEGANLLARALRLGAASCDLPAGGRLSIERVGEDLLRASLITPAALARANAAQPFDYDRLPVAIIRLAADGTVLDVNQSARAYAGEDVKGRHLSRLLDGLGRPMEQWLAEALSSGRTTPPEVLRASHAGAERYVQVSLHPEAESGTVIAVLSDARALKTLEAQFVQSQKMQAIGQLAGGIAHDFNNLLTAISGHCDLLMLRHDKGDPDYADLDQISQNANRAANLVSHLLAFSRKQTLKPQRVDLRNTIADLSHLLNRLVGEKVRVEQQHDPRLLPVRVDRGKIEQVIMNLVVNARDAMPDGGRVDITTQNVDLPQAQPHGRFAVPAGRYVRVTIADHGCGVPPDLIDKIFEPFFTTKRVGEGTGLGLSTVYGIIKQTGGYILCDSAVGQGTVFTIYLPVFISADLPAEDAPEKPADAPALSPRHTQRVLLVEDEAPVRAFASRALKLHGYHVTEAASGEEALEILNNDRFEVDVFVTDVVMPGLDGLSWVRRALKDRPGKAVIFMSGYTEDVFEDGRNPVEGASFLQKPFSLTDLVAAVGQKVEGAGASSEIDA